MDLKGTDCVKFFYLVFTLAIWLLSFFERSNCVTE